jgi:hypothetical protein
MSANTDFKGQPVPKDTEYYKLLFSNSPAVMPDGFKAKLEGKTTYELMQERDTK